MVDDAHPSSDDVLLRAAAVDVQATFCSTLVDEWIRRGVRHAVISPGSRSTPMALAVAARDDIAVHVVHDERAAAFVALGLGSQPDADRPANPALLLCTSGTAAANYLPAVVEAGLSAVPMIVLTADRPDELRGVGAPQTIDQVDLYGSHTRWSSDPGVPEADTAGEWRSMAADAWRHSSAGPVQLNLAFREPLVGTPLELPGPDDRSDGALEEPAPCDSEADAVPDGVASSRGVILVGGLHGQEVDAIVALNERTGWPIVADPQSGLRHLSDVTTIDALLRVESFATEMLPDVIVRMGRPSTSKMLAQWSARPEPVLVQIGGPGRIDPGHNTAAVCSLTRLSAAVDVIEPDPAWRDGWRSAESVASGALDGALRSTTSLTEPLVARTLADHLPSNSILSVSSSMPVRDLEWFGGTAAAAHANRGANGIDGVMSTALGRALGRVERDAPTFVLIGDLAFVHDSNALVALTTRRVDLRIVVVDNGGGGIFSFLPQRTQLAHERFEQLFGTPLGTDVLSLASAHGVATDDVETIDALITRIGEPGPWVCRVRTDRADNVEEHRRLHEAVAAALDA